MATWTLVERSRRMMATEVSAQLAVEPERVAEAEEALTACFAWLAEVEHRLTRFDARSELSALNRSAGAWFAASETLYAAVEVALLAARASDGLFNPALLHEIEALGYDRDFSLLTRDPASALPEATATPSPPALDAWRGVALDPARRRIRLPGGAALDLGGIAKGWAADVALERYCQGFPGALVNVGGDLRLYGGPQPGQPWAVGLSDPHDAGETRNRASLALSRGALATSGAARRWWSVAGERRHHLLDPRTGRPLPLWTLDGAVGAPSLTEAACEPLIATVTALASTGARAEAATKVALARGETAALAAVERAWRRWGAIGPEDASDVGVALIITLSDGRIRVSRNLDAWLASWGTAAAALPMYVNAQGAEPLELEITGTFQ